jgi:fluoride ion exporter CrcB/FEX
LDFIDIVYREKKLNTIPPIIGILFADIFGNAIMTFEYSTPNSRYGSIKSYLINEDNSMEIDLVSGFFSSFSTFASTTNIKDLSHLEVHGSNYKIQIHFLFDKFMAIVFLNSNTVLSLKRHEELLRYLKNVLKNNEVALVNFNNRESKATLKELKKKGNIWLKRFNKDYVEHFKKQYQIRFSTVEDFVENLDPIIKKELVGYFPKVPKEVINDLRREIKNKIQDKTLDLVYKILKNSESMNNI